MAAVQEILNDIPLEQLASRQQSSGDDVFGGILGGLLGRGRRS